MGKPQCGSIKLDATTLKTIEGVITEANTLIISSDTLVTACGQQWDGGCFKVVKMGNRPIVTYCANDGEVVGKPIPMKASCGLGVDSRFFELTSDKSLKLNGGYLLRLNVTPDDATVSVLDTASHAITPISGTTNQYICSGNVSVTVQKDGYTGHSETVVMNANKDLDITLEPVEE